MTKPIKIVLLGSTGSIGTTACRIVENHPANFRLLALACGTNAFVMAEQIKKFKPLLVSVKDYDARENLKEILAQKEIHKPPSILIGEEGMLEVASVHGGDLLINGLVGSIGLTPTIFALKRGLNVALANKETLVIGGKLVMETARENGATILPIDSEHSAIFQCLQAIDKPYHKKVRRIILTASGGPFWEREKKDMQDATPDEVLKHPNWDMGPKVTVDSASLMNKGLEIIEAKILFELDDDQIDVVIHRQSIVHSMVEFTDGSILAQMGHPNMEIPIQLAMSFPDRFPTTLKPLDLTEVNRLTFEKPDDKRFPCLEIAREASRKGGLAPACLNGSDEGAVELFLKREISFGEIPQLIKGVMKSSRLNGDINIGNVLKINESARNKVLEIVKK